MMNIQKAEDAYRKLEADFYAEKAVRDRRYALTVGGLFIGGGLSIVVAVVLAQLIGYGSVLPITIAALGVLGILVGAVSCSMICRVDENPLYDYFA